MVTLPPTDPAGAERLWGVAVLQSRLLSDPSVKVGNHDKPRMASAAGAPYVRLLNMLLLTLPGTPTTYYGEEIGMENVNVTEDQLLDPVGKLNAVSNISIRTCGHSNTHGLCVCVYTTSLDTHFRLAIFLTSYWHCQLSLKASQQ